MESRQKAAATRGGRAATAMERRAVGPDDRGACVQVNAKIKACEERRAARIRKRNIREARDGAGRRSVREGEVEDILRVAVEQRDFAEARDRLDARLHVYESSCSRHKRALNKPDCWIVGGIHEA